MDLANTCGPLEEHTSNRLVGIPHTDMCTTHRLRNATNYLAPSNHLFVQPILQMQQLGHLTFC